MVKKITNAVNTKNSGIPNNYFIKCFCLFDANYNKKLSNVSLIYSVVKCPLVERWIVRSIPNGGPIELFLCYLVCQMVHLKDPLKYYSYNSYHK